MGRWKRRRRLPLGQVQAQADVDTIYDLEMRNAVVQLRQHKKTWTEIGRLLEQSPSTVKKFYDRAMDDARVRLHLSLPVTPPPELPPAPDPRYVKRKRGPGLGDFVMNDPKLRAWAERNRASWPAKETNAGPTHRALPPGGASPESDSEAPRMESSGPVFEGEIVDPPDVLQFRKDCLRLRKAMISYAKIAEVLGISQQEARMYTAQAINDIQQTEHFNADMHRQLMLEQYDQMIAAIHAPATGEKLDGTRTPVILEAIDRMLRIMKQKADLLGISEPPAVDIRIQIQRIASEGQYDIRELEDIAKDVLAQQKLRLPEFQ